MTRHVALVGLALMAAACVGTIGDGAESDGEPVGEVTQNFECDASVAPSPTPLRRLSYRQYRNTLRDLSRLLLDEADADAVLTSVALALELVPREDSADYRALDQDLNQLHIDSYYKIAIAVGRELSTDARLGRVAGDCARDADSSNDADCVRDFVTRFGKLAFRRPLTGEEIDFYAGDALDSTSDVAGASFAERIAVMLMAPEFIYLVEDEQEAQEGEPDMFSLSPYELAARLSYLLWRSMPDEELLTAAEDGSLQTEEGYVAQVDRLLASPRAEATVDQFVAEWLRLEELPELDAAAGTPAYDAFVGNDAPSAELRLDMIEEVQALFRHYTLSTEGTLGEFLTSDLSFAQSQELAGIYGVSVWTPGQEPPRLTDRAGLLTRAALVASGSAITHPVLKGKLIRTRVLCDDLPPPPQDVPPPPSLDPDMTVREQLEELTEKSGTACAACHATMNPLGYITESFDGLGRYRETEKVYDLETGELLAEHPVDTVTTPQISPDDERSASTGAEVSRFIADSGKAEACIVRHYFRYSRGRLEDAEADGCALESLNDALVDGGSLRAMFRAIALDPSFKIRTRQGEAQ